MAGFDAQMSRSSRRLLALTVAAALFVSGCSLSSRDKIGGISGPSASSAPLTCDDVSLGRLSGRPTNKIDISAIPADFGEFPAFKVVDTESNASVIIPVAGRAGQRGGNFVVPVHPTHRPEGGPVTLTLFDGDGASCSPINFLIEPLPESPGAYDEFVKLVGRVVGESDRLFFDPDGSPMSEPLDIARDWKPDIELPPESEPLIDGLIEESGVIPELEKIAEGLEGTPEPPPTPPPDGPPAGGEPPPPGQPDAPAAPDKPKLCTGPWYEPNATMLSWMMTQQEFSETLKETVGPYTDAVGGLATVIGILSLVPTVGIPNPVTIGAGGVGAGLSAVDVLMDATEKLLPSEFVELTFVYDKATYLEDDEDLTGYWDEVMVTARNRGMSLDGAIFNAVLSKATGGLSKRFLGKHIGDQVMEKTAKFLTDTFSKGVTKGLIGDQAGPNGLINLPACDFGPTDITDYKYHYAEFDPEDGPGWITPGNTFAIMDVGLADLVIHVNADHFGGRTMSAREPVEVKPIELIMTPDRANGDPGYTATFTLTVNNANDTGVEFSLTPAGGHILRTEKIGTNVYQITVATSPDGNDFPSVLLAESTSTTGLRAKLSPQPRVATALLTSGGDLTISPWSTCVEPGETAQFTADVSGYDNKNVTWDATGGTVSSTGLFKAPKEEGNYYVRATSVADARTSGQALVTVAENCMCWAAVSMPRHGILATTTTARLKLGEAGREDELHILSYQFRGAGTDLETLHLEFYARDGSPPPERGEPYINAGTYSGKDSIYYDIRIHADGTREYYAVPHDANPGSFFRQSIVPGYEPPIAGPVLGQSGSFPVKVWHPDPLIENGIVFGYGPPGSSQYRTTRNPSNTETEIVATVVRPRWKSALSTTDGYDYAEHILEFKSHEVSERARRMALRVDTTIDDFQATDEPRQMWLKGSAQGQVAVYNGSLLDPNSTFAIGPIQMNFQGLFDDHPAAPGTHMRMCTAPPSR